MIEFVGHDENYPYEKLMPELKTQPQPIKLTDELTKKLRILLRMNQKFL